jgi:hypothetical protein
MLLNVSLRRLVLTLEKMNKRKEEEEVGVASNVDLSKNDDGASEELRELEVCVSLEDNFRLYHSVYHCVYENFRLHK